MTTDGGNTWNNAPTILHNLNRIRKINDTLAFAVCNKIWKYSRINTGVAENSKLPEGLFIKSVSPNPFIDKTTVIYHLPYSGNIRLRLYDFAGRPIRTLKEGFETAGEHEQLIDLPYFFNTHFYIVIHFEQYTIARKIISIR
jgi:hypothetical protein